MGKAYYDSENKIVSIDISGVPELKEFQKLANSIIDELKNHNACKLLNNTLDLEINSIENQEWAQAVWFPKAEQAGLKYFAFVTPKDIFGQVSAEQTNENAEQDVKIEIQYFDNKSDAKEWLKTK